MAPALPAFRAAAGGRYSLSAREDRSTDTDDRACVLCFERSVAWQGKEGKGREQADSSKCFEAAMGKNPNQHTSYIRSLVQQPDIKKRNEADIPYEVASKRT